MNKIILRNKLLATIAICAVTLVSSNSYAVNISQYIQSSYGEGDASVTIDVVGTPVEVKYQSIYGEGDQSKNYTINILGQDVDIIAKYHSENLNTGYENYGEDHSNETIIRDFVDVESCYNGVLNHEIMNAEGGKVKEIISNLYDTSINYLGGIKNIGGLVDKIEVNAINSTLLGSWDEFVHAGSGWYDGIDYTSSTKVIDINAISNQGENDNYIFSGYTNLLNINAFSNNMGYILSYYTDMQNPTSSNIQGLIADNTIDYFINYGAIVSNLDVDFIGNSVRSSGIFSPSHIENISGDFINNYSSDNAKLITNDKGQIKNIVSNFVNNQISAIKNENYNYINNINSNFINNIAYDSQISNRGVIDRISGIFVDNTSNKLVYPWMSTGGKGGAITNESTGVIAKVVDTDFLNNVAEDQGGAIYNEGTINIVAETKNVLFSGNVANGEANAIHNAGGWAYSNVGQKIQLTPVINLQANEECYIIFDDGISGGDDKEAMKGGPGTININNYEPFKYTSLEDFSTDKYLEYYRNSNGEWFQIPTTEYILNLPHSGTIIFNESVKNNDINMYDGTLKLGAKDDIFENVNMTVYGGLIDTLNGSVGRMKFNSYNVLGAVALALDVDLEAKTMDHIESDKVDITSGTLNVTNFLLLSDATENSTQIPFIISDVVSGLENVTYSATANSNTTTYDVTFDTQTGQFVFVKQGNLSPEEVAPNQAPALTTTTTVATVETVVAQIFDRDVTISTDINYGADTTDYMETSDGVNIHNNKSVWVKTFGSDDDLELDNFNGTIDAEAYGVVGGVDSKVFTYDNGVKAAYGIYGAYVGGKQKYNDSKIEQKSGYLGVSAAFRKSNLFSNFTLNGGYITSEANTEWGKDKFDTKTISVANKTGVDIKTYNNWKITPALYVAYTGMDTEDYTNKAGVKMENEFSNVITIAPELKVSNRIGKDLDGYAKVSYKHYIYDAEVKADDVVLEEMSAKPYVEYGFGVEKNWADKSGYAELTRRSGGRTGWNVNLGLNFDF